MKTKSQIDYKFEELGYRFEQLLLDYENMQEVEPTPQGDKLRRQMQDILLIRQTLLWVKDRVNIL